MSDLQGKFTGIEAQLAAQHTEIVSSLDAITTALGVPPSTTTTTLDDVVTALNQLNTTMSLLRTDVVGYLSEIYTTVDTINNNASLNAQRLLIAIAANDPCKPCDVVPIEPPPLDVTPQTVDQEHCKRMQALIYALRRFTVKLDVLSSFGLGFSPTVIRDAITEVITELGVTEQLQYPSLGEVAQLAGAGAVYVVSNVFEVNSLPANFMLVEEALLPALYAEDNASDGQAAYRAVLAASGLDPAVINLFSAMGYTSIFNLYYDRSITLDLAGYDGTICAPENSCVTIESSFISSSAFGFNFNAIVWPAGWPRTNFYARNNDTLGGQAVLIADLTGCTIRGINAAIQVQTQSGATTYGMDVVVELDGTITEMLVNSNTAFSVEFCGPTIPPPGLPL